MNRITTNTGQRGSQSSLPKRLEQIQSTLTRLEQLITGQSQCLQLLEQQQAQQQRQLDRLTQQVNLHRKEAATLGRDITAYTLLGLVVNAATHFTPPPPPLPFPTTNTAPAPPGAACLQPTRSAKSDHTTPINSLESLFGTESD